MGTVSSKVDPYFPVLRAKIRSVTPDIWNDEINFILEGDPRVNVLRKNQKDLADLVQLAYESRKPVTVYRSHRYPVRDPSYLSVTMVIKRRPLDEEDEW